ncbi:class I SAM-dependent methyltransferase [Candidatus Methanoperedens nitratireducens]|uniref:Putative Methyltransferase type 12 n=1 Tax=Candidatus Methanoperedens nitratireducens TaxID=1392998 RepID=A0A284VUX1_9EURY|nr:class I SAM-dependent methyltransferase [Candidatus Methanoperedens nitroreducens]SNQ62983.1 putative Methyltransferase type 12 [Candidatus Methanoperedens nitroreducens]
MKEKLEKVKCPKCGTDDSTIIFRGRDYLYQVKGEYFVSECRFCGLWFQNPRPVADELINLYPTYYSPHASTATCKNQPGILYKGCTYNLRYHIKYIKNQLWKNGIALVPQYVPNGKLLEIGCASGDRLISLRSLGWQHLYGIELVPAAVEKARVEGFSVDCGPVEEVLHNYPDKYFDVIISSMVLEHLYNPFKVVQIIASKLKPGGQFLFSTISRDSLDAKIYGAYWAGFDFPRHMVHFRNKDILDMIKDYFTKIKIYHQAAPIDFIRSSKWRRDDRCCTVVDKIVLTIGESRLIYIAMMLSWLGFTCRVSVHCQRK